MAQFHAENERIKRRYLGWMKEADGKDESTLDQVAAFLRDFEMALGCKPFKAFHRDWARRYKTHLDKCRHHRTGKPLSLTTRDARLRQVKAFFKWLASQPGYKSRVSFADVEYFNNTAKDARAAHAQRPIPYPSLEQCAHAFRQMPSDTETERRDRAIFAALMLTGARDGALASLRLRHVDLAEGKIIQDGREVRTKGGKSFETWFFPVDQMYRECFEDWVRELREKRLHGPADALFPKVTIARTAQGFANGGLSREPYANAQTIRDVIKTAFRNGGMEEFTPHSFRKTLAFLGDGVCDTMEARKAWSQNLGHEHLATTVSAYMPVSRERQKFLISNLSS
ncbi:tyrosine-type recombinase/integrase [Roseivivax sediminis]|uniref:Site-specific recombinase XerD n=1 Tax=Roseivivax sediminis TaxID=936889 RepID=A0A1I1VQH0_9RHOB|nr:site-specific integrase [Roseivivax sediminis]SFD85095.1 Site-specific recombinase XerD [Roseivivax sediminis]